MKNPRDLELARLAHMIIAKEDFRDPPKPKKLRRETDGNGDLLILGKNAEYSWSPFGYERS